MLKRNTLLTYVDTSQTVSEKSQEGAKWALLGEGIEELTQSYNSETETKHFIHQSSGTTQIKSYAPTIDISQEAIVSDEAYKFFDEKIRRPRAIGADAETYIVNVEGVYDGKLITGTSFPAELQKVSISINDNGGSAEDGITLGYALNYIGDAVWGTWDATTKTWSDTPFTAE